MDRLEVAISKLNTAKNDYMGLAILNDNDCQAILYALSQKIPISTPPKETTQW